MTEFSPWFGDGRGAYDGYISYLKVKQPQPFVS
jgi:hypothetical protein